MRKAAKKRKAAWEDMMKQSIFEATVEVMKKHGPGGIRMDRVAKTADMATGTLYNYFKDKEALLLHVVDTLFEPYHVELKAVAASEMSPPDKLEAYFHLTCRYLNEKRDVIAVLMQAKGLGLEPGPGPDPEFDYRMAVVRIISEIIQEGIAKGVFRKCEAFETAAMTFGAMDGFVGLKIRGQVPERTVEEDIEICRTLILQGILADT